MFNPIANSDSLSVFDKTVNKICPKPDRNLSEIRRLLCFPLVPKFLFWNLLCTWSIQVTAREQEKGDERKKWNFKREWVPKWEFGNQRKFAVQTSRYRLRAAGSEGI